MSESAESSVTMDGFSVSSTDETPDQIRANFESDPKPLDGEPADPEKEEAERVSKAASELGKKGAAALAAKKAEAAKEEPEEDDEPEEGKKAKPGSGNDLRLRMKALAAEKAEAARELAAERAERQKLAAELAEARKPKAEKIEAKPAEQKPAPGKPKASDFENYEDFIEAMADYKSDQRLKARDEESGKRQQASQVEKDIHEWKSRFSKRVGEAVKADPEFATKLAAEVVALKPVYNAIKDGEPVSALNFVADEIVSSERPTDLMVYFTENPKELQRLATLRTPHDVVREMAKVEAKLNSTSGAASTGSGVKDVASKAKTPVKPVTGSPSTASAYDVDEDTPFEEHVRRMNGRDRARARGAAL